MNDLTLLIPAKNESESLPKVLEEVRNLNCKKKIILKKDDILTIDAIKNFDVDIIYQNNSGYGDALITGINNLDTSYFCIFNADGSFNPNELTNMLNIIKSSNSDFVFASRYQNDSGSEDDTIITLIGNKIFTFLGKIIFGLPVTDILYTFVLGKSNEVKKLELKNRDFCLCVELPIKAKKMGMTMMSSDSYERKRIAGKKKVNALKDGSLILFEMFKLFFINLKK
ncbi:glycosyltransferase [Candidatus Pelagibacter sp.]|jgi:glycosyltransferase involved in cell wall biosynthesis|nr:glycosyltransferase [Candidatus Pelagibacter sp.]